MQVLILSSKEDAHAQVVMQKLDQLGVTYALWNFEQFLSGTGVRFDLQSNGVGCIFRLSNGQEIDLQQFKSVWYRRAGLVKPGSFPLKWVAGMVESEGRHALAGILRTLPCLWVNHPGRDAEASFKLFQLDAARRSGLIIPETIVTNEPDVVADFYEKSNRKVIYKLLGEGSNFHMPNYEFPLGIPTLPLREVDLQHLQQVRHLPHLFQRCIEKAYDLRVTIIGKKIFPFRIHSQSGRGKLDWRMDYDVPMELCDLPPSVNDGIMKLMRTLGLNYGAMDIVVDEDGQHVFIEVNCAGQYLWLEQKANVDLSLELAKLLAHESEPIVAAGA